MASGENSSEGVTIVGGVNRAKDTSKMVEPPWGWRLIEAVTIPRLEQKRVVRVTQA